MNKNVESIYNQVVNTLDRLYDLGVLYYYQLPTVKEWKNHAVLSWNNYQSDIKTSERYFIRPEQYCKIISTSAYWALLKDYSIIRGSFEFINNKLIKESLLWWPCPVILDDDMVNEFGIDDSVELSFQENNSISKVRMRTPMRFDFDVKNNRRNHPRAHLHMQNVETRINTCEPICFNRFMDFVLNSFYLDWKIPFDKREFVSFPYKDMDTVVEYDRKTKFVL